MIRKISNKILAVIFIVLLAVVVVVKLIDSKSGNSTFKKQLVNLNAEDVTSIEIVPKANNFVPVVLNKEADKWMVESGGSKYNADNSVAGRLISGLNNLKTKSVATSDKARWEKYEVTDSLGTCVKVYNGSNLLADVVLGKFSYSQPRNMTTYVRLAGDDDVYAVDGMPGMQFNRKPESFRDRTVIKSNKNDWTKLTFSYPADSSFVLQKNGDKWMIGSEEADSAVVAGYFNKIASLTNGDFYNQKPKVAETHRLTIEGNNQMQKIEVKGYFTGNDNFIIESGQNSGTYFNSKSLAEKIFISPGKLKK